MNHQHDLDISVFISESTPLTCEWILGWTRKFHPLRKQFGKGVLRGPFINCEQEGWSPAVSSHSTIFTCHLHCQFYQNDIFLKKKFYCVWNISDIITITQIVLYSPSCPPSSKPNSITIAPVLAKLAYLSMLFITHRPCTASRTGQMKNKQQSQIS